MPQQNRFAQPWEIIEHEESFEVRTAAGVTLGFIYFAEENRRAYYPNVRLTKEEARRLANAMIRLPELLKIEKQAKSGEFE